jgi:Na+/proline symporter
MTAIGTIVAFYVMTRMVQICADRDRKESWLTIVFATLTFVVTVFCLFALWLAPTFPKL